MAAAEVGAGGGAVQKVRLVRCPKCRKLLPEPQNLPLYLCGGCGVKLQAKNRAAAMEASPHGNNKDAEKADKNAPHEQKVGAVFSDFRNKDGEIPAVLANSNANRKENMESPEESEVLERAEAAHGGSEESETITISRFRASGDDQDGELEQIFAKSVTGNRKFQELQCFVGEKRAPPRESTRLEEWPLTRLRNRNLDWFDGVDQLERACMDLLGKIVVLKEHVGQHCCSADPVELLSRSGEITDLREQLRRSCEFTDKLVGRFASLHKEKLRNSCEEEGPGNPKGQPALPPGPYVPRFRRETHMKGDISSPSRLGTLEMAFFYPSMDGKSPYLAVDNPLFTPVEEAPRVNASESYDHVERYNTFSHDEDLVFSPSTPQMIVEEEMRRHSSCSTSFDDAESSDSSTCWRDDHQDEIVTRSGHPFYSIDEYSGPCFSQDHRIISGLTHRRRSRIFVNGQYIPRLLIMKAELHSGPIEPGECWYDYLVGFWGVMGHPCLGVISPFVKAFNYPMPKSCAAGNTGVLVNGRELHKNDLDAVAPRGLPTARGRSYIIDNSGKVWDEASGTELGFRLGEFGPT